MRSKLIIWKSSHPLSWIYQLSLQKKLLCPTITCNITTIHQRISSMHLKGNTQIHILKLWVPLRSVFYLSLFHQTFVNSSQQTESYIKKGKHSKRQFNFSNQQRFIHQPYQYQTSNLKKSLKCIMWFEKIPQGETLCPDANVLTNVREKSRRS